MAERKHINVFLILMLMLLQATLETLANCILTQNQLRNDDRLIITFSNNRFDLIRRPIVTEGTTLFMICNQNDITAVTCRNNRFNQRLPLRSCTNPLQPARVLIPRDISCAFETHSIAYTVTLMNNERTFELYRVCFDRQRYRTVFTTTTVSEFFLPRADGYTFDPDDIFTPAVFSAYNKRDIFRTFETLLGPNQRFFSRNEDQRRIDRGHLTAAGDFMTNNMIRNTFKMINVIPQFHSINNGNWRVIEEWARNANNAPARVCSGAFNMVLRLPNRRNTLVPIYLRNNGIPIPLWTYKIVRNRANERTAFLQYNNIHDTRVPQIPREITCTVVRCPLALVNTNALGFTYCCEPTEFKRNFHFDNERC
uniref:DNA/RNA non-specific endonuclease/pyrophosphatase/phosphodiesterase domain-containing protein n=1 Tax=Glossina brevipalpis TaxID=37001 RepID=A0A1A9WCF3_9MUSC